MQYRRALLDSLHGGQPGNTGIMGGQNPQIAPMTEQDMAQRGTIYHGPKPPAGGFAGGVLPGAGGLQPNMGMQPPMGTPPPAAAPTQNISKFADRDPNAQWTRQDVLNTLKQYGPATRESLDRAVKDNPWLGQQVGNQGGKIKNPRTGEIWDVIGNLSSGNGTWQTLTGHTARANGGGADAGGGSPMAGFSLFGGLDPRLMGDAGGGIQSALGQFTDGSPNIQALLKQLQGQ